MIRLPPREAIPARTRREGRATVQKQGAVSASRPRGGRQRFSVLVAGLVGGGRLGTARPDLLLDFLDLGGDFRAELLGGQAFLLCAAEVTLGKQPLGFGEMEARRGEALLVPELGAGRGGSSRGL